MASAGARAYMYNGGLGRSPQLGPGAEPLVRRSGGEAPQKLKAVLVLDASCDSIFAVFIRVSADKCMTLYVIQISLYSNQQKIGVSEGNEKGR